MKNTVRILCAAAALCLSAATLRAENPKPFVIPELREWKGGEGDFTPTDRMRIVTSDDPEQLRIADRLAEDYAAMFGRRPEVVQGKGAAGDILLSIRPDRKLGDEGYAIRIGDRVQLTAPHAAGLYWGTRTLLQIAEQHDGQRLPCGSLRDWPDYGLRGFLLDCGRKYIPMAYLRDLVKIMSYYKMNTLQVHLNDNGFKQYFDNDWNKTYAAFRLESETFPGLTARDGSYTKREFVDFQREAAALGVEIIPEIDVPAHSLAFTHYKPEIGSKEYGMDHLDLFEPATYEFLDALFAEYLSGDEPVFCGPRVSIGTDEYSNRDKEVVEQFRAFTDRYIRYVESFGKQASVWGALTHAKGDTPVKAENVVMNAWYNGYAEPKEMAALGYQLVSIPDGLVYIVPAAGYYYDYLNTKHLYENWTPAQVGNAVFEERDPAILGGMFAVWNDHAGNGISVGDIHHRTFPALQTLAVKSWAGSSRTLSYDDFDALRKGLSEAPGVNRLGRLAAEPGLVHEQAELAPESTLPYAEIGYDYLVTFDIEGADETPGTELFRSDNAVFYLADPIRGMLGFARDGYLCTFSYKIEPGRRMTIGIGGDNRATRLLIDGKVVEELNIRDLFYDEGKSKMRDVRTLVFPLERAGRFRSRITDLKIYQQ
ncbi:MAG: family 20 glycosylhydrolase [Alistipes sp.]|nr:family 20 glycosylhydrolase [Alistipes sp.]